MIFVIENNFIMFNQINLISSLFLITILSNCLRHYHVSGAPATKYTNDDDDNNNLRDSIQSFSDVITSNSNSNINKQTSNSLNDFLSVPAALQLSSSSSSFDFIENTQLMSIFTNSNLSSSTTTRPNQQQQQPAQLLALQVAPLVVDPLALLETSLQSTNASQAPKSDKQKILDMFYKFFIKARSHDDQQQKEVVRDGIIFRLRELGFETSFLQKSRFEFRRKPAVNYNMISILPGKYRQTKKDRIILVGAHWDSATKAPGVDDNGSGSTCLLEIARIISENRCNFEHTIMLVWFDYEEQGKFGSEFFVNDYLFPLELEKYQSKFIGAFILDMILVRDKENNTQTLPTTLRNKLKEFNDELEREKNCGDFLAAWSRKQWDEPLENAFRSSWIDLGYESRTFKAMRPDLPQTRIPNSEERYEWKDFFRSDHASFWFPPLTSNAVRRSPNRTSTAGHTSLNAILLTDLGPWRKSYQKCYHSACDDEHFLTDGNLAFMQQVIDSLVLALLRVGHGECKSLSNQQQMSSSSSTTTTTSNNNNDIFVSSTTIQPTEQMAPSSEGIVYSISSTTTPATPTATSELIPNVSSDSSSSSSSTTTTTTSTTTTTTTTTTQKPE